MTLPPRSAAARIAAPQGGCFAWGRPGGGTVPPSSRQKGAALLLAMLTVTLVATLASAALWQQWRSAEIERAERQRVQAGWILTGALDWARLILREDARGNQTSGNADHLGEPWALPLEEARLSSFLAADKSNNTDDTLQAFLSGEVVDMQSRLNFNNLVRTSGGAASAKVETPEADLLAFTQLFEQLGLPLSELTTAAESLRTTTLLALTDPMPSPTPLLPQKLSQLGWLGISRTSLAALEPHVTVLPERTALNLNTASAEAISATVPGLDMARAQEVVAARERNPFKSLGDVVSAVPATAGKLADQAQTTRSRYFEVRGRLRLENTVIEERSLVVRNELEVRVRWRERYTRP